MPYVGSLIRCWWECEVATPEGCVAFLGVQNMQLPCNPASSCLGVYPREVSTHFHTNTDVHTGFVCNSYKLKIAQMSLGRRLVKQAVVHPCRGCYVVAYGEQSLDTRSNLHESPGSHAEGKANPKGDILYKFWDEGWEATYAVPAF